MFAEPERTSFDVVFPLFGFSVRIHPMFWLVAILLYPDLRQGALPDVFVWILAAGLSILIHELGHAVTMKSFGILSYIVLYTFGGLTIPAGSYGGYRRASMSQEIAISAAGPLSTLALAFLIAGLVRASGGGVAFSPPPWFLPQVFDLARPQFEQFLNYFLLVSILWAYVNLLPIYPLDGGKIARELFVAGAPGRGIDYSLTLSIATAAAMAVFRLLDGSPFGAVFFGYLAYNSYQMLQGQRRFGGW